MLVNKRELMDRDFLSGKAEHCSRLKRFRFVIWKEQPDIDKRTPAECGPLNIKSFVVNRRRRDKRLNTEGIVESLEV